MKRKMFTLFVVALMSASMFAQEDTREVISAISFTGFEGFFKLGMTWDDAAAYALYERIQGGEGTNREWWNSNMQPLNKWNEETQTYERVSKSSTTILTAGKYYLEVQIRIEHQDGLIYRLPTTDEPDMIVTVDGNNWPYSNEGTYVCETYSYNWLNSPEFTLDESTGIDQIDNRQSTIDNRKFIKDGQLFILRDGRTFNAQGAEVK